MIRAVGIGPSGQLELTERAKNAIETADCLFGSERQLTAVGFRSQAVDSDSQGMSESASAYRQNLNPISVIYESLKDLSLKLADHQGKNYVVLASGDPSFYGIAKYLGNVFGKNQLEIIPGISSVQYLFSKAQLDMNDLYMTSAHGRALQMSRIMSMPKTAVLTDEITDPYVIAEKILSFGEDPIVLIGESLGSEEERITVSKASEVVKRPYAMNVVVIDRSEYSDK